ncbi:MAG: PQQ-binding-like beta-propeller repeat protein [Bryobacteraceae bacterium]
MRPARVVFRIVGSLAIAVLGIAHLFLLYGMRIELSGEGVPSFLTFRSKESHYERLEASRKRQATPVSDTAPAATPSPVAAPADTPATTPTATGYWTDFRGPGRKGHYEEMAILTRWPSQGLPLLWRQPAGEGYASFVVAGGLAYTIEQRRGREVVAAYDVKSGREAWTDGWEAKFSESMGGDGPRTTPVWHDGRIYALGAEGEFRCLDAPTGKVHWRRNILTENGAANIQWGVSSSPLVVDDKVVVMPGGPNGKSVIAYHRLTGEPVWSALDDKAAYTSPMVVTLGGRRQLLLVSAKRAMGLTVEKGELLWEYPWVTEYDVTASQPIVAGPNRFFISAGYDHGAALVEITPEGNRFAARTVWSNNRMKNRFNSAVLYDGHVYGLDEGILACMNLETGDLKWKGGRYGYGQLLLASDHLVVLSETGDAVLVRPTPEKHDELARFSALDGRTWNHPAIDGGKLLVRNAAEMACYRIGR